MTAFWIVVALLLAGALLFVLPPLLRGGSRRAEASQRAVTLRIHRDQLAELQRDRAENLITQEQYEAGKRELERRVLEEAAAQETQQTQGATGRWIAPVVGVLVPLIAIGVYLKLGNLDGLNPPPPQQAAQGGQNPAHDITPEQIEAMVAQLAERMKRQPDDAEGWVMLARANQFLQRYDKAAEAFAEYVKRVPNDAQVLADYADALAMAKGRSLQGEPEKIIAMALAADPNNLKALWLAGSVEFDRGAYAKAVEKWERIVPLVPPDSEAAKSIANSIAEAREKGKLAGAAPVAPAVQPAPAANAAQPAPAAPAAKLSGTVTLSPALKGKVSPEDTVFVFARAPEGPRMPLAILRKQVKDLPLKFELDDSMAMTPAMKLSNFPQVVVGARVSKTGDAMPQKGDLQALTKPLAVGSKDLAITIDGEVN